MGFRMGKSFDLHECGANNEQIHTSRLFTAYYSLMTPKERTDSKKFSFYIRNNVIDNGIPDNYMVCGMDCVHRLIYVYENNTCIKEQTQ